MKAELNKHKMRIPSKNRRQVNQLFEYLKHHELFNPFCDKMAKVIFQIEMKLPKFQYLETDF